MHITHHGATRGVTGSCHQLHLADGRSVLIDCGLFQGAETSPDGRARAQALAVGPELAGAQALVVTHVHIDHVGRVPPLLAAGFAGPIVGTQASAELLPLVLEDALQLAPPEQRAQAPALLARLRQQLLPLHLGQWHTLLDGGGTTVRLRLHQAGHILGSAWVELQVSEPGQGAQQVLFSGDLGATDTPLLPDPALPRCGADVLVMESTYGDRLHDDRRTRRHRLQAVLSRALANRGTVLIPAFSVGRTQELLYELEDILHTQRESAAAPGLPWQDLLIVVDSPDRKSTRLNSSHSQQSRMPSSA